MRTNTLRTADYTNSADINYDKVKLVCFYISHNLSHEYDVSYDDYIGNKQSCYKNVYSFRNKSAFQSNCYTGYLCDVS
jgi:hypothetical protein